jgi:hypothetical protein
MSWKRLLSISDDYDVLGFTVSSDADSVSIEIRVPPYNMGELRTIQYKQEETGFITADELMRLQKAGFNQSREVPPKPQPKDRSVLRERARQRTFQG